MMAKITDNQVIIFSVLLFAGIYIAVNTDIISNFFSVIQPFINGIMLAYLTGIIVHAVEKKLPFKYANGLSLIIVYLLATGVLTLLLVYLIPIFVLNAQLFAGALPSYLASVQIPRIEFLLESFSFSTLLPRLTSQLVNVTEYAKAATASVINGVLAFVISVYILLTKDAIFKFISRLSRAIIPNQTDKLWWYIAKSHLVFKQFLVAQLFASLILGVIAGVVLAILGVNYAILIATIIGIANIVPLIGAIIGVIVAVVILFLTSGGILAWVGFAFLILLQQIDATIITPKLMGNALNLNPIIIILVLAVGTSYFGFVGVLFAVPITAMIREILKERLNL